MDRAIFGAGRIAVVTTRRCLLHPLTKCSFISSDGRIKSASCAQSSRSRWRRIDYSISSSCWRLLARLSAVASAFLLVRVLFSRRRWKQIDAYMLLAGGLARRRSISASWLPFSHFTTINLKLAGPPPPPHLNRCISSITVVDFLCCLACLHKPR